MDSDGSEEDSKVRKGCEILGILSDFQELAIFSLRRELHPR